MTIRLPDEITTHVPPDCTTDGSGALTLDDLERLCFTYGGTIEPRPGGTFVLVGAVMDGRRMNLGPVHGEMAGTAS